MKDRGNHWFDSWFVKNKHYRMYTDGLSNILLLMNLGLQRSHTPVMLGQTSVVGIILRKKESKSVFVEIQLALAWDRFLNKVATPSQFQ